MSKKSLLRYGIAFLLGSTFFLLLFYILNIEPFQSRYFLTSDLFQQYYVFHTWFGKILRSGDWAALFYEWSAGLGNPMLGTYAYYLSSPFSLLAYFFDENTMPLGLTLILTLKIGSITTAFYWLLTRLAQQHQWSSYFFALCYAFSGFTLTYLMNLMWLDQLIVLPILFYTTLLFVHKKRNFPLLITLLISFWVNFYTAYMSGLFVALIVGVEFFKDHPWSEWKTFVKLLLKLMGLALTSFSVLAFLLLPTMLQLFSSNHSPLSFEFELLYSPLSLLETLTTGFYDGVQTENLPPLYFGLLPLIFSVAFFFQPEIPSKERKLHLAVMSFLFLSFLFNPLYNLWHGFKPPVWFAGRHSFIFIFYNLYLAFRAFELQSKQKTSTPLLFSFVIIFLYLSILTLAQWMGWVTLQHHNTIISSLLLSWLFLFLYSGLSWLLLKPSYTLSWRCLFYFGMLEVPLNAGLVLMLFSKDLVLIDTSQFQDLLTEHQTLLTEIKTFEHSSTDSLTAPRYNLNSGILNSSLLFDYSGLHSFNTLNNPSTIPVLNHLTNHVQFGNSTFFFSQAHPILNSILGVSYLYSPSSLTEFYLPTPNQSIYYNPYALSLGFKAHSDILDFDLSRVPAVTSQSALLNALIGTTADPTPFLIPAKTEIIGAENLEWLDEALYEHLNTEEPASLEYHIYAQSDQPLYLYFPLPLQNSQNLSLTLNGVEHESLQTSNFIPLTEAVTELKFSCPKNEPCGLPKPEAYHLNKEALQEAFLKLQETQLQITEQRSNHLTGTISFEEPGILFTSIPFDKGWHATINEEEIETISLVNNAFLGLKLPAGNHVIELTYTPPGFKLGLFLSITSFNGILIYALFKKMKQTL